MTGLLCLLFLFRNKSDLLKHNICSFDFSGRKDDIYKGVFIVFILYGGIQDLNSGIDPVFLGLTLRQFLRRCRKEGS